MMKYWPSQNFAFFLWFLRYLHIFLEVIHLTTRQPKTLKPSYHQYAPHGFVQWIQYYWKVFNWLSQEKSNAGWLYLIHLDVRMLEKRRTPSIYWCPPILEAPVSKIQIFFSLDLLRTRMTSSSIGSFPPTVVSASPWEPEAPLANPTPFLTHLLHPP